MDLKVSVPSKTFLVGEYAVLNRQPGLVITTNPRFEMTINPKTTQSVAPFHINSPAGKFLSHHSEITSQWKMTFADPYQGLGGLGASSAEFVCAYSASLLNKQDAIDPKQVATDILQSYRETIMKVGDSKSTPSGVDVVAQAMGGIAWVDTKTQTLTSMDWPFEDLGFLIVHTHQKLKTHEHLEKLETPETSRAQTIIEEAHAAFVMKQSSRLVKAVNDYALWLESCGLVHENTKQLLRTLKGDKRILAAKGCGAMGADTLLVLAHPEEIRSLREWLTKLNLQVLASQQDLAEGLRVERGNV